MDILGKIGFDWQVALANFVNFLIIFLILKRFAWKPLSRTLKERKQTIEEGIEKAALAETALIEAGKEKDRLLQEARQEASRAAAQAEQEAQAHLEKRKEAAEAAAQALLDETRGTLARERVQLEREIRESAVALAVAGAEAVLEESVDRERSEAIARKALFGEATPTI